jgi:hypothetical protein
VRPELKRALVMPITQLLDDSEFDRETKRAVSLAFEMAREALQLGDQSNLAEKTAQRIVELAKGGELDSDLLCESVVGEFRQHL